MIVCRVCGSDRVVGSKPLSAVKVWPDFFKDVFYNRPLRGRSEFVCETHLAEKSNEAITWI